MNIIFVCTGNTCRSPMAEAYLKSKCIPNLNVASRGFSAGEKAQPNAVQAMKEVGIDISQHISHCIAVDEARSADAIICMDKSHKNFLSSIGISREHLYILNGGIPDPFGSDIDTYRSCRDTIFSSIDTLIKKGFFENVNNQ